ncbi:hypothetical protein [Coxiella-like endosymbiont]|uniref:hypothetical protein n=1 Tax=Coxiella-like endosymbiont TaxID=1592897 RepID=UPI00272B1A3E|nr:hypothetical protein [Coxiella-like endosymbiont]
MDYDKKLIDANVAQLTKNISNPDITEKEATTYQKMVENALSLRKSHGNLKIKKRIGVGLVAISPIILLGDVVAYDFYKKLFLF